jgi:predicted nucleic acid-binding protein
MPRVIPDTSCLILLKKIGALNLLNQIYEEVLITDIVIQEFKEPIPISFKKVEIKGNDFFKLLSIQLDPGEASVISMGSENSSCTMIIDDLKGRKIARALDLNFTGTLGVLVKAKRNGLIEKLEPYVEKLIQDGIRISNQVLEEIKKDYP